MTPGTTGSVTRHWRLGLVAIMLMAWAVAPASARVDRGAEEVPIAARALLERLSAAFVAGDHEAVAALIHPDGARVGLAGDPERINELSPAQAHYYFKALFQTRTTLSFDYQRHHVTTGDRVLARAVWRSRGEARAAADVQRVLVTLARHEHGWRLTELTAIRGG